MFIRKTWMDTRHNKRNEKCLKNRVFYEVPYMNIFFREKSFDL
jgi:hypothetical protein